MHRLFVALRPPAPIRGVLADLMEGVAAARWQDDAQLHLTLRFIGDLDGAAAEDAALTLSRIVAAPVEARLAGVGSFGSGEAVTTLWAGVEPRAPLAALHAKVDRALAATGIPADTRAYLPHITVARLARTDGRDPAIAAWLARHAGLTSAPFPLAELILYESRLGRGGARYERVAAWPLVSPR